MLFFCFCFYHSYLLSIEMFILTSLYVIILGTWFQVVLETPDSCSSWSVSDKNPFYSSMITSYKCVFMSE